jgi:putative restriction endonuclease
LYIGVTDGDWYRFLAARPGITEVNFWLPGGGRQFRALSIGEPFAFKSHYPDNRIVGLGFFSGFDALRLSEAWDLFGEANGAPSLEEMRRRVFKYRRLPATEANPTIGCVMLRDVEFLPPEQVVDPPEEWARSIVQGKTYDARMSYGEALLRRFLDLPGPDSAPGDVFGDPRLSPTRLGQRPFQALVLTAYQRRCAVTGDRIVPVLQAAHIRPVTAGGENRVDNGLLLRSDVHTLFDRGYLGIHPSSYRLLVSPSLRREFENGEEFYARAGDMIALPERRHNRPHQDFLAWHADTTFRAS